MNTSNAYSTFFVVAALVVLSTVPSTVSIADDENLSFSLTPSAIGAGERATLEIRLPKASNTTALPRLDDALLSQATQLVLLHSEQKEEAHQFVWRYDLTSYKAGELKIPPLAVKYGPNFYSTEQLHVSVTTHRSEDDDKLREDYPALWMPIPWKEILSGIALLGFFLLGSRYLAKKILALPWNKLKPKPRPTPLTPGMDPLVWLKRELKRLKERAEKDPSNEALVDDLTLVIKRYLSLKYAEPFPNRTTGEFEKVLKSYASLAPLLEPFKKMDDFKFSGKKENTPQALLLSGIETAEMTLCGT